MWTKISAEPNFAVSQDPESDFEYGWKWLKDRQIVSFCYSFATENLPRLLLTRHSNSGYSTSIANPGSVSWLDHARIYKSKGTGKCWLVCHNYDAGEPAAELLQWCRENNLLLAKENYSWYCSSSTSTYVITLSAERGEI